MFSEFKQHIETNFPYLKNAKILIAISGGIDSTVLTHLLYKLKYDITLAHCNFKLRKLDSDKDELFVKNLSECLQANNFFISFKTEDYAVKNKLSIQEAARNLRYQWFDKLSKENNFNFVLTAHNLDDNLETFLINLTRGTGLCGLLGIPIINKKIRRPLLAFSRKEIYNYAKNNNIIWREDQSNTNIKYTRNKIRHQIIPVLKSINEQLLTTFKQTLSHLNDSKFLVDQAVNSKFDIKSKKINIKKIQETNNPKAYLHEILKNYGFTAWRDIENLLIAQSGKQVFSKTHRLIKDREYLLLIDRTEDQRLITKDLRQQAENCTNFWIKENENKFKIKDLKIKLNTNNELSSIVFPPSQQVVYFDKNLLKFPLQVRKWKNGDYFYPLGMQGKKKLSKFFKDEKYSLIEKENIWLLLSDNKIVWVIGKRQDNRFKITKNTKQILEIMQL